MLSYRKSQQVSLTEKLKKKNVIHVFGVSGSGTTMARFCLSAFVRVATYSNDCTVYMGVLCLSAFVRVATLVVFAREPMIDLCHSAFVRVATQLSTIYTRHSVFATAHSCGLRRQIISEALTYFALPQRIRAGCDDRKEVDHSGNRLCHSAFVRVATL